MLWQDSYLNFGSVPFKIHPSGVCNCDQLIITLIVVFKWPNNECSAVTNSPYTVYDIRHILTLGVRIVFVEPLLMIK